MPLAVSESLKHPQQACLRQRRAAAQLRTSARSEQQAAGARHIFSLRDALGTIMRTQTYR